MYNTIYIRMVVGNYGGYVQALRVVAMLDEEGLLGRKHLKEVRKLYGGDAAEFSAFRTGWAADPFAIGASTSRDAIFNARMEKNLNKVAEQVRQYVVEPGKLADQFFVEFGAGEIRYHALFHYNRAFVAAWDAETEATQPAGDTLLITDVTVFRGRPDIEADMLGLGKSARENVAAAFRAIDVQDMLEKLRGRPDGVSIRTAFRNWSQSYGRGYPGWGNFMYRQGSKWVGFDSRAVTIDQALQSRLDDARVYLRGSELVEMDTWQGMYGAAGGFGALEMLSEMRRIAGSAYDLSKRYAEWLATKQRSGDPTETVAEPVAETGEPRDNLGLLAGSADVLDGGAGIDTVVAGVGFGEKLGMMLVAHMRGVDAAIAAYSSLPADQIRTLHGEISGILGAFESHVQGSLHQMKGERMLSYQDVKPTDAVLEDSYRALSGLASSLAVLGGLADALRSEELHVAAREIRYRVIYKDHDGRLITMLRMKENTNRSVYFAWVR